MQRSPAISVPPAVLWLSAALILIHVIRQGLSESSDEWTLLAFAFVPARYAEGGAMLPGAEAARFWSPLSYAFLHADFVHLFVNIVWMASFGAALARRFGSARFLVLSAAAAVAGAALYYALHSRELALVIGASGAVSGMMAAAARFAFAPGGPLSGGASRRSFRVGAEPLAAMVTNRRTLAFILIWFAVNLLFGLTGGLIAGVDGPIAWEAHIGGFLAGLLLFPFLDPVGRDAGPEEGAGMITPDS